jgi:hypothetical protein
MSDADNFTIVNRDKALMEQLYAQYRAPIAAAAHSSSVPEALLAALIANESGGDPKAQRYEREVFLTLAEVLLGKRAQYFPAGAHHPLGVQDLLPFVEPPGITMAFPTGLGRLSELATSYGLTQIMGWHALEFSKPFSVLLNDPRGQLDFTVTLLSYFAERYQLDPAKEFAELFTCWNCGRPDGQTFDPHYVSNGLARMALYEDIRRSAEGDAASQNSPGAAPTPAPAPAGS